jgi:hypothetical protein
VEAAMIDDTGGFYDGVPEGPDFGGADFDGAFFTSLEAGPVEDAAEPVAEDLAVDEAIELESLEGEVGAEEILYEAEGDGSFETDAADFEAEDFPFDLGGEG